MTEFEMNYPLVILAIGVIILFVMLIKSGLERTPVPSLVGFLGLGFLMRLADDELCFPEPECHGILGFLAKLGLVTLLFRVGLESNLKGLLNQLRRASVIWVGDVLISGSIGFAAGYYVLHLPWITSVIVATAFTATSVGISVAVWEEAGALQSKTGELLIDVAELDEISAVLLMGMLFAVLPNLKEGASGNFLLTVSETAAWSLVKLLAFGALCYLFSRFIERPMPGYFKNLKAASDPCSW